MVDEARARKETKEMLKNPQMYRAYWWHVVIRTILEVSYIEYSLTFNSSADPF